MTGRMEIVDEPIAMFARWMDEAWEKGLSLANSVALATAASDALPDVRYVLLKRISEEGCEFYTNSGSPKSMQIKDNPHAAMAVHWQELGRQVRVRGPVSEMGREAVEKYFATRPRDSQLSAWASHQSRPLEDEQLFLDEVERLGRKHEGTDVPLPGHWSGFIIVPLAIEFWVEGQGRMHDRMRYCRDSATGSWSHERLYP